ncbi:hypothetical protein OROMI_010905 [Orobanche minor]
MKEIIESDDAERFKSLLLQSKINARPDGVKLCYDNSEICPFAILGKICHHRAYNCATLLLDHEVGSMMDLNLLNCCGSFPIHDAAISLSASMVKLLLDHGARRETLYSDPVTGQDITPLDCAVERLSCDGNLINWSPNKSVFKLIIILCLPQMKEARETISLLIPGVETCSRVLPDALLKCVKRGQVASVASLLLVDRVEVCDSVFFIGDGINCASLPFSRSILNELASLINQEYALMGRNEHTGILQLCLEKKKLMIYILHLLEIFKRVGPGLDSYMKTMTADVSNEDVSRYVSELFEKAGFNLSNDDTDLSDLIRSIPKPEPVVSDVKIEQQGDAAEVIWFKPRRDRLCHCDVKNVRK